MNVKHLIGDILIFLTTGFTVYIFLVMRYRIEEVVLKDAYTSVFRYELIICAVLLLCALDLRFGFLTAADHKALKLIGWILRIIIGASVLIFLFFLGKITAGSMIRSDTSTKNALVLGLALEDGKPAPDLISRLKTAEKYAQENPDAVLILTGGNPGVSGKSEADVMHDILIEWGMDENRLRLEDQARSTKENFRNAAEMIDPEEPITLITSDYHMDRAVMTAKKAGFTDIRRLPAPSSRICFGANVMWEVILKLNELTLRQNR